MNDRGADPGGGGAAGETVLLVEASLDGHRFGLLAADVQEVLRAATPTPLAGAPPLVSGILDLRGTLVAVYDVRARFGLPPRPLRAADHLVVADAGRKVVIVVDRVDGLVEVPRSALSPARDLPAASSGVAAVARLPDGMIVLLDLRGFLDEAEGLRLDALLSDPGPAADPGPPSGTTHP